jgi:hypothetical protein
VHSKKALDVRIGRPFTKRIVRWDWTKHSDKAQGPPVVFPWPVVIAISQEGPISPGRKRSLIPALRAFARWSLVPSASAPVGRLCDNSSAAMGAEERRRNGARAALHQHIHWAVDVAANLPICSSAKSPMCPRHNQCPCCGTEGKMCWHTAGARGINTWAQRE